MSGIIAPPDLARREVRRALKILCFFNLVSTVLIILAIKGKL